MKKIYLSKCVILFYIITRKRKSYLKEICAKISYVFHKQTGKIISSSDLEKNCTKYFLNASNSSNIKEEIIKQLNKSKPFNMEPRKAIPKKYFVSEEENACEEEINLTQQDRISNID